jgi:hypothetical protein
MTLMLAGVLSLLAIALNFSAAATPDAIAGFLSNLVLAVAFVALALRRPIDLPSSVAFIVGAAGWAAIALTSFVEFGRVFGLIGDVVALAGTIIAGILVCVRHAFSPLANALFLVLAIAAVIRLLLLIPLIRSPGQGAGDPSITVALSLVGLIAAVLFDATLILTGIFVTRRSR